MAGAASVRAAPAFGTKLYGGPKVATNRKGQPALDSTPPRSIDAERGVLGSILLDGKRLDEVRHLLTSDSFYRDSHQTIYRAILDQAAASGSASVDTLTVAERLRGSDLLEEVGGAWYLGDTIESVPHAANAVYYAEIVHKTHERRQLLFVLDEQRVDVFDCDIDIDQPRSRLAQYLAIPRNGKPEPELPSLEEFLQAGATAEQSWLVDGLIAPGWLAVLGGMGKRTGKTTLVVHLTIALRTAGDFLGRRVEASPVIILDYENTVGYLSSLFKGAMADARDPIADTRVITRDLDGYDGMPPWPLTADRLKRLLVPYPSPGLVVIDSARGAFGWRRDEEKDAGVVGPTLRSFLDVARRTGWTVLVIHHANKAERTGPESLSGSSEWISAPDLIMTMTPRRTNGERRAVLQVDGRLPPVEEMVLEVTPAGIIQCGTTQTTAAQENLQKVLEQLSGPPGDETGEIAKRAGLANAACWRALRAGMEQGKVGRAGDGVRGDPHTWYHLEAEDAA